jgi:hypothetical protein
MCCDHNRLVVAVVEKPTDIIRLSFFLSCLLAYLLALLQGQSLSTEELQLHVMKRYNNLIMLGTLETHVLIERKKGQM